MSDYLITDNKEHVAIDSVLSSDFIASASKAGIMKLFTALGSDTDGAPTNKAVKDAISSHTHVMNNITDLAHSGANNSSNGWANLPNGAFICWGTFSNTGGHGNIVTVSFPKAFSSTNYGICFSQTASSSNETWSNKFITEKSTTYFKFNKIFGESLTSLNYIAVGY